MHPRDKNPLGHEEGDEDRMELREKTPLACKGKTKWGEYNNTSFAVYVLYILTAVPFQITPWLYILTHMHVLQYWFV